jgi:hypothetical protein
MYRDGLQAGRLGFDSWQRQEIFLYSKASRPDLGPSQPTIQCTRGALSPGVERPRLEANHSRPSIADIKNDGAIPPLPHTYL